MYAWCYSTGVTLLYYSVQQNHSYDILHSPAAYIALFYSFSFGSQSQCHLASAIHLLNSPVPLSESINSDVLLLTPVTQRAFLQAGRSSLQRFLDMSSVADIARLLSVFFPLAASWLSVTPSEASQFLVAIKWWLGLDFSHGSCCPLCLEIALDPLGHHAVICKRGDDVVSRHNKLHDVLAEPCGRSHLGVQVEMGSNVAPNHSTLVLLTFWFQTGSWASQQLSTSQSHPRLIPQLFWKPV